MHLYDNKETTSTGCLGQYRIGGESAHPTGSKWDITVTFQSWSGYGVLSPLTPTPLHPARRLEVRILAVAPTMLMLARGGGPPSAPPQRGDKQPTSHPKTEVIRHLRDLW